MKNKPHLGQMRNEIGQDRAAESHVNMLKNNDISIPLAERAQVVPALAESPAYYIPAKVVYENSAGQVKRGLHARSKQNRSGNRDTAREACDGAHCASAGANPIFEPMTLRPNHAASRAHNRCQQPGRESRSREHPYEIRTVGGRPMPHANAARERERRVETWKRPTPHVLSNAGSEASCVE